ncbi:FG-GAP-like repeat-containing protein [Limnohabitans sp. Rim47]|uniref:beta strand repeat-containing protein n=1 Tax=Limnohabitans sp. Rim47 TaxID=1100721 RepID=UPI0003106749|nr:FG-GAP-like repeat-containing protein [Limnohabitans sp. Rim47]
MQKIIATLTSPEGVVSRQTMVKFAGQPIQLNVPAGTKLDLQVQGQAPAQGKTLKADAKPELKLQQAGNKLLVEGEGEVLVEVADFYANPNSSVGSLSWDYSALPDGITAQNVEGKAATEVMGSSVSEASNAMSFLGGLSAPAALAVGGVGLALASGGGGGGGIGATSTSTPAAPTLSLAAASQVSPSQIGATQLAKPTFTGTAQAGASVNVYDSGLLLGTAVANSLGVWSVTSSLDLGTGRHSNVYAVQTDPAGNISPASAVYTVTVLPVTAAPTNTFVPANYVFSISSSDINGDGALDIGVAVRSNFVALLKSDGTGVFSALAHNMPKLNVTFNTAATGLVDFNGDGRTDVISLPILGNDTAFAGLSQSYFVNRGGADRLINVAHAADAYTRNNLTDYVGFTAMNLMGDINGDGFLDFSVGYYDSAMGKGNVSYMLSTGAGLWRQVFSFDGTPAPTGDLPSAMSVDLNGDGLLDRVTVKATSGDTLSWLANAQGGGYTLSSTLTALNPLSTGRSAALNQAVDLNGDGFLDLVGVGGKVAYGSANGQLTAATLIVSGATANGGGAPWQTMAGDVNGDGRLDMVYSDALNNLVVALQNTDGTYTNGAAGIGWGALGLNLNEVTLGLQLLDVNGDRSLDFVALGAPVAPIGEFPVGQSSVKLNTTVVAENTFLRVVVANDHGGQDAYGAVVRLYDSATGALVAMRSASTASAARNANFGSYGADFFGLDPAKTYDVAVVYPGSDKQVTVVTGKAGLGVSGINSTALNQIVDSSLTGVSAGGKDVIWVAKENRSTSTTGGYWQGANLADQMVGDKGNDVFKPNGARAGEVGDTLTGGGGNDRFVFDVKATLNTGATITDFTATAGAEADSIDMGALLTAVGYTGARTAAGVADWVKLVDVGGKTTVQVDAHAGTAGAASGFVDLVTLNGVSGKSLAQLVSGGFVHLGGVQVSGVVADQTVTEAASQTGVKLAAAAVVAAEGGQWAAGFTGGKLVVSLSGATAADTLGFDTSVNSVGYDSGTRAVSIGGTHVGTVSATDNGVGALGKLAIAFDFAAAGANYATEAQQAQAVQAVMQSLKLTSASEAPTALDRAITFTLTDALGDTLDVYSGLHITPLADNATLGGVNYVTGTESVETLTGTVADETIIGYNGVPTASNLASLNTALTFGDTLTGGGGKDTFKWLSQQLMNSDASDKITDFGLKGGTGTGQGTAEADVLDLSALLKGYNGSSTLSDYVQAVAVGGKVQIQVDFDGKANGSAFEKTWFMTLDNLTVNGNNEVLANGATVATTSGNLTLANLVQQMVTDSQFKLL